MDEYFLGGKGKAVDDQSTSIAEKSKLSQERIILVSQVLLLLKTNGLRMLRLRKHNLLTMWTQANKTDIWKQAMPT